MSAKQRKSELEAVGFQPPKDEAPAAAPAQDAGTRAKPVKVETPEDMAPARERVNQEPSEAQVEAGNYRKGHVVYDGLPVSIENPKGSTRRGVAPDGSPWEVAMPGDYGYIKNSKGADKDHVDILIGDKPPNGKVFVVDQNDPATGKFDEHKVIAGVGSVGEAARLYAKGFSDGSGPSRIGAITEVPTADLQDWLSKGQRKKPMAPEPARDELRAPDHAPEPAAPAKDWEAEGRRAYENKRERMVPDGLKGEDARAWERGNRAAQADAIKAYVARARRNAANRMPTSLVQFLRGMGGVRDDGGDLKSQDMHRRFIGLVSSRGVSLDQAREAAAEAGYLGHDKERAVSETTVSDLLDALMDHPRYSVDDEQQVHDMKDKLAAKKHERRIAAKKMEISSFMDEHGLSPDPEAVERAAALMVDERMPMEDAFERAVMQLAHETPETKAALDATATEDGFDAIPWDEWTGPVGEPVEEAAASPTRGGDQEAGGSRPARDEGGGPSADSGRHSEPARAAGDEEDQAPRDEGKRSEPDQGSEVEPPSLTFGNKNEIGVSNGKFVHKNSDGSWSYVPEGSESEQHAASRRMEDALDAIEIAQESGDRSKVLEAARDAKRILAETPQAITATDPEYWAQFPAAIKRMSAEGWKPITLPEATEPTVEPGADNKPQTVIPGAEKISDKALAEKKADEGLKPKVPQKGAGGMFDEAETAPQLFDAPSRNHDKIEKGELPVDDARERERQKKVAKAEAEGLQLTAGEPSAEKPEPKITVEDAVRITKARAKGDALLGQHIGEYTAVGTREAPWGTERGFGETALEAQHDARRRLGMKDWKAIGAEAFKKGEPSIPPRSLAGYPYESTLWARGWHEANIAEPVPGVDMPGRPAAPVEEPKAGLVDREKWNDGRWKAVVGDKVYQRVPGFGGMPARIDGVVYGKKGTLRVEITGSASMIGSYSGPKTVPYDHAWTVEGDPRPGEIEAARKAAADAKEKEWRDGIERDRETARKNVEAAIAAGDKPMTFEAFKPGLIVRGHHPDQSGDYVAAEMETFLARIAEGPAALVGFDICNGLHDLLGFHGYSLTQRSVYLSRL